MGRFLEHSRIFRFGDPGGEREVRYTIGSGDLMERNLDRRIEVLVPVLDLELQARLEETLELNLADDTNAWELGPDGAWTRSCPSSGSARKSGFKSSLSPAPAGVARPNQ